jgi:hypothetical protein
MAFMQENTRALSKDRNMRVGRDESRKGRKTKKHKEFEEDVKQ